MKFIAYNKLSLINALDSGQIFETDYYPTTYHRALSQLKNPNLDDNDVILIVAKKEKVLIGYLGILPQFLYINGERTKIGILTTWWVNPNSNINSAGFFLLQKALKVYDKKIIAMDFSEDAQKIYENMNFKILSIQKKTNIYFFFQPKNSIFKKCVSYLLNFYCDASIKFWLAFNKKLFSNVFIKYTKFLNKKDEVILQKKISKSFFKRSIDELNWVIQFPWVKDSPDIEERYYFSAFSKNFKTVFLKIFSKNKNLLAIFMIKKLNNSISIPYQYIFRERVLAYKILLSEIFKSEFESLSFIDPELEKNISNILPFYFFYRKNNSRKVILTADEAISSSQTGKRIYLGDGDSVFT